MNVPADSVDVWIKSAKKKEYDLPERKAFLDKARIYVENKEDSVAARKLSEIAYQYWKLKDTVAYKELNHKARLWALKNRDTFLLADTHWSDGTIFKQIEVFDSAYFHFNIAYKYFEKLKRDDLAANMLYGMAFAKGRFRDYTGAEVLMFKAITKYKGVKNYKNLYSCYNHLAILQRDIHAYEKALHYHGIALNYLEMLDKKEHNRLIQFSLNNMGLVYRDQGNYQKALSCFNRVLGNVNLEKEESNHYARVLDNRAYCKLLNNDTLEVKNNMHKALGIREHNNNKNGIVLSKLHLTEFYAYAGDTLSARKYASEAQILAREVKNSRDYLKALQLLSELNPRQSGKYFKTYLNYNDSLLNVERNTVNKFTRIDFETDEYIKENERLSEHRKWLIASGVGVLSILSLIYYIRVQRIRNRNLLLEAEQQRTKEEYYQLTIKQQLKLEEEKRNERNRISAELHDGVLSDLYGIRMQLGFLNLKREEEVSKEFEDYLEELQAVENEIRNVSHRLNSDTESVIGDFNSILRSLLDDKSSIGGFKSVLQIEEGLNWEVIDEEIKLNLYRILQELLQNIVKHSKADKVIVAFGLNNEVIRMSVKDNGVGFENHKAKKGIGHKTIKSRVKRISGLSEIKSTLNKGTEVVILIPVKYS
ncbi:sensor histidine kinase [Zhouia spongiae]|uniref:histidine kinase n=1 Tax=Zhouia spongiae TaxID=2202721 RepID=A0ABY3YL12_9FLAO|nr:sensor histidine kinase [Zhouia spongiae]UNY98293.1 sensor histidine kinase [Zhouia spongiae]